MVRKDIMNITIPIIAEQAFIMLMGVVNAVMAGHLGKEAVSAIGMVDSINNIFIALFSALAVGGTVVVAQYSGQENHERVNEAARHALLSGLLLALLVTASLFGIRYLLLGVLFSTAEPVVMTYAQTYLNITLITYPLIAITSIAFGVLRGNGDTKSPMIVTILMNIINVILSYILIYGFELNKFNISLTIPGFGVSGAAFGIAIARTVGALLILYILFNGSNSLKLVINCSFRFEKDMLRNIFGIGFPASVESMLFHGGKLITQIFIVGMGTAAIAANYVASSVFGLLNIPGGAFSIAATALVGQCMGRGESEEARGLMLYLTKLTSLCLLVLCFLAFPFANQIASIYTNSKDVIPIAATLIRTSAIFMPIIWAIAFILPAGIKGAGDAKYTMVVSIFGMWVFRITLGYILGVPLKLGVLGIWIGMYADWLVRGILFYLRFQSGKWEKKTAIKPLKDVSGTLGRANMPN